jgi:hypothetical protein
MPAPITTASQLAGAELLELELLVELGLLLEPLALELLVELLGAGALGTGGREAGCDLRGWDRHKAASSAGSANTSANWLS